MQQPSDEISGSSRHSYHEMSQVPIGSCYKANLLHITKNHKLSLTYIARSRKIFLAKGAWVKGHHEPALQKLVGEIFHACPSSLISLPTPMMCYETGREKPADLLKLQFQQSRKFLGLSVDILIIVQLHSNLNSYFLYHFHFKFFVFS